MIVTGEGTADGQNVVLEYDKSVTMRKKTTIRLAYRDDRDRLPASTVWRRALAQKTVLVELRADDVSAAAALDIRLAKLRLHGKPSHRLLVAAERLAARYSLYQLFCTTYGPTQQASGYTREGEGCQRGFVRRRTRYQLRIQELLYELGLPIDYARQHLFPVQLEASRLTSIGQDIYQREQRLTPAAARAWSRMRSAAAEDSIELQPVSAFRSVDYQAGIIRRKLESGQDIDAILEVSAAPGFSEHHTGRAIDITTPGSGVLEEDFEQSTAFTWLSENAERFDFAMSFPRKNVHKVAYEPWHWAYAPRVLT